MSLNIFSGARHLRRARAERKAIVADYYRNEAGAMSATRRARLMAYRPADPLLTACVKASTFLPHNPVEAERIMREALAVTK